VFGFLGYVYPKADWAPKFLRAKSTFQSLARNSVEAYMHSVSLAKEDQRDALFSDNLKQQLDGYSAVNTFNEYAERAPTDDPMSLIQYIDIKTYLVGDILTKVDRASMAHSLEVRVPLLDHKFVEWISSLPPKYKLKGREGKYALKKSLESHLPHDVLYRPKMGFGVPLANWFRGPLKERLRSRIVEGGLANTGLFNQQYLEKLVSQHQSGARDHSAVLWSLLMFEAATKNDNIQLNTVNRP
jgi:asparagine synthase (glutamine-hydrolysing)